MNGTVRTYEERSAWDAGGSSAAMAALGLGCYIGWQLVDISPTLFAAPRPGVYETLASWGYAATAVLVALLALFGVLAHRTGSLVVRHPWIAAVASLGTCAGTALLYLCGWAAQEPLTAGVVAGRLLFACSAGFVVLWGELLSRIRPANTLACVAAGYAVAFGACLVVANLDPVAAMVFRCALPLVSGSAFLLLLADVRARGRCARDPGGGRAALAQARLREGSAQPRGDRGSRGAAAEVAAGRKLPYRLFAGIGVFGAVFTAANHLSETKTEVSTELYTLIAGIAVSLAVFALSFAARHKRGNFALFYRLITPLVIGCLLLTLVLQPGIQRYEALAIGLAWTFFRIFTWTFWGRIGSRDPERGACVFAAGQIMLTLSSSASELLCTVVNLPSVSLVAAGAAIIFVVVVTSTLVMDEGSVARLLAARAPGGAETGRAAPESSAQATGAGPGEPDAKLDPRSVTVEELAGAAAALGLSDREREIALLVLQRLGNGSICDRACITESTLRTHLRNIYGKADVHSRTDLIELLERLVKNGRAAQAPSGGRDGGPDIG